MEKKINLGTVQGRHPLPVEAYVLQEVTDPTDVEAIQEAVNARMQELLGGDLKSSYTWHAPNCVDYTDTLHIVSGVRVNLFVTGLTVVTLAVVNWCVANGTSLTCWHYDRETGTYFPQYMYW